MTQAFGAIDLFGGSSALSGTNSFVSNKDPTNVMSTDPGQILSNPSTIVDGVSSIFENMPEILVEIFGFLLLMPIEILLAFLGGSGSGGLGGLLSTLLDGLCGIATGTKQTGTTPTGFVSGTQSTVNNFCGLLGGGDSARFGVVENTSLATITAGLQGAIAAGSTMLTGTQSITTAAGLIPGGQGLMNDLCALFLGDSLGGPLGTPMNTNGATVTAGLQGAISTGSTLLTGTQSITTGAGLISGGQGLLNDMCSMFTGSSATGTNGSTVSAGMQNTIATGSNVLTGNTSSVTSGSGVIGGFIGLLNSLCGLCTGDSMSPAEQRLRGRKLGLIGPAPVTNGNAIVSGVQGWIGTGSLHLTGNADTITTGTGLATAAQGKLDFVHGLVGGSGSGNTALDLMTQASQYQIDSLNLLGNPEGIGTGNPVPPPISNIPLLGTQSDITSGAVINGLTNTTWFTDLTSFLGAPSGLGTGEVQIGTLGSIPILEPIAAAQSNLLNVIYGSVTNSSPTNASAAQVGNALAQLTSGVNNAAQQAQVGSTYVDLMAVTNPGYHAVDSSLTGVFSLTSITGTSADTIEITQTVSALGFILIPASSTKSSIVFYGSQSPSGISDIWMNLYSINAATSQIVPMWQSANIASSVGTEIDWVYIEIPPQSVSQGQWVAAELAMSGTGSLTIVGLPNHWMGANTNVFPQQLAASRSTILPVYDTATSYGTSSTSVTSGSWSHTLNSQADAIYAVLNVSTPGSPGTVTASVGGSAMTQIAAYQYDTQYAAPVYDATGGGYTTTTSTTTVSGSWSHNAAAGAAVVVAVGVYCAGHASTFTISATYNGVAMTPLGAVDGNASITGWVAMFSILNVVAGSKTVAISISGGSTVFAVAANSVSYTGVGSFGTPITNVASSTAESSGAITSNTGQVIAQAFAANSTSTITPSSYSATSRYSATPNDSGHLVNLTLGDAPGQSSLTITQTLNNSDRWSSIAVPVQGNIPNQVGGLYAFQLTEPPTGAQMVSFTLQVGAEVAGTAVSYEGDGVSAGSPVTVNGTGTALSQTVTGTAGELVLQVFAQDTGEGTISSYNQTLLSSEAGSGTTEPILMGQVVATGSSQTFTAASTVNLPWGSIAIPLASNYVGALALTPTYSQNIPWLALSSEAVTSEGTFAPTITSYDVPGTYTFSIPFWANYIDVIVIGGGGGAGAGGFLATGVGGSPGQWAGQVIQRSTDFLSAETTLTVTVGGGGALSAAGGNSSITWTNLSDVPTSITGPGGAAGAASGGTKTTRLGLPAPAYAFDGATYLGGQATDSPGGGGSAAFAFNPAVSGGAGAVWIVCRAAAVGFSSVPLAPQLPGTGQLSAVAGYFGGAKSLGVLSVAFYPKLAGSAAPHGQGVLVATGGRHGNLHAGGALSATAAQQFLRAVGLSGHGVLSATDKAEVVAQLSGQGVQSPTAFGGAGIIIPTTGFGHFTATTFPVFTESAALPGVGALSAITNGQDAGLPELQGVGTLSATAYAGRFLSHAPFAGTGKLSNAVAAKLSEATALTGHGALLPFTFPTYDTTGTGYSAVSATSTMSWTHNVVIGNVVYVWISTGSNVGAPTVTYGGAAMTEIEGVGDNNNNNNGDLYLYSLSNPAAGTQTVEVVFNNQCVCAGNSTSYASVQSVSVSTAYSNQANPSQAVTVAAGQLVVQGFSSTSAMFTRYSGGTGRYVSTTAGGAGSLVILDSTATTTFNATMAASPWAGITLTLS